MQENPSTFKKGNAPVESVRWTDAMEFCFRLNRMSVIPPGLGLGKPPKGYEFTLPTEAQWEYACRVGVSGRIADKQLIGMAVAYMRNGIPFNEPQQVGSKNANAWGLYDMLGNVEEWCLDIYRPYPQGPVVDPVGQGGGREHVIRGGAYMSSNVGSIHNLRAAVRDKHSGYAQFRGFRLAAVKVTEK